MKIRTPEQVLKFISHYLDRHTGTVKPFNIRYAFQLSDIKSMPDCNFAGAIFTKSGIFVYIAGADSKWIEEHEEFILSRYYRQTAQAIKRPFYESGRLHHGYSAKGKGRKSAEEKLVEEKHLTNPIPVIR